MSDKSKALSAALSQIERQFGKGSVMRMGDQKRERIPAISTGSLGLDIAVFSPRVPSACAIVVSKGGGWEDLEGGGVGRAGR